MKALDFLDGDLADPSAVKATDYLSSDSPAPVSTRALDYLSADEPQQVPSDRFALNIQDPHIPRSSEERAARDAAAQLALSEQARLKAGITPQQWQQQETQQQAATQAASASGISLPTDYMSAKSLLSSLGVDAENYPTGQQISRAFPLVPQSVANVGSSIGKTITGLAEYATSPKGIGEMAVAASPIGLVQKLRWFVDMAKGTGEGLGVAEAKYEKFLKDPQSFTDQDLQELNDSTIGVAAMLGGAAKLGEHTASDVTGVGPAYLTRGAKIRAGAKELANILSQNIDATMYHSMGAMAAIQPALRTPDGEVYPAGFSIDDGRAVADMSHEDIHGRMKNSGVDTSSAEEGFTITGKKAPDGSDFFTREQAASEAQKLGIKADIEEGKLHSEDIRAAIAATADSLKSLQKNVQIVKNDDGSADIYVKGQKSDSFKIIGPAEFNSLFADDVKAGRVTWDTFQGARKGADNQLFLKQRYSDTDPIFTHEIVHLLKGKDFINSAQWGKLKELVGEGDLKSAESIYPKEKGMSDQEHSDLLYEEAIARKFEDWHRGDQAPDVDQSALQKIMVGVKSIWDAQKPVEKLTPEQVMKEIIGGKFRGTGEASAAGTMFGDAKMSKQAFLEVAPNPDNAEVVKKWSELPPERRIVASREIANDIIPKVLENTGVTATVDHDFGYFENTLSPNVRLEFPDSISDEKVKEATVKAGYVMRQKAVIVLDENNKGEGATKFLRIKPDVDLTPDQVSQVMEHIGEGGSRIADGSLIYANFTDKTDAQFFDGILNKVTSHPVENVDFAGSYDSFKSEYIDNLESAAKLYEDESYKAKVPLGEEDRALVQDRQGGLDSIKSDFDQAFERYTRFSKGKQDLRWWGEPQGESGVGGGEGLYEQRTFKGSPRKLILGEVDGEVPISHWSSKPRDVIDPKYYGSGIVGEEGSRRVYKKSWVNRSYYGIDGYSKESGLGSHRHDVKVDAGKLYDFADDPDGFHEKAIRIAKKDHAPGGPAAVNTVMEKMIKDAGYIGYFSHDYRIAAIFDKVKPERVVAGQKKASTMFSIERILAGEEKVPQFETLGEAAKFIKDYSKEAGNRVVPKGTKLMTDKGREMATNAVIDHTMKEIGAWKTIVGNYRSFYLGDITDVTNPKMQQYAEMKYGRKLTQSEVQFAHLLSAFGSGQATPIVDTQFGIKVLDEYMKTGRATGYSDLPKKVYKVPSVGAEPKQVFVDSKTGGDTFSASGNEPKLDLTRKSQTSRTYNVAGLERFNLILDKFEGSLDKTIDWLGSKHSFDEIKSVIGDEAANKLGSHEYLSKDGESFGVFALGNNPKLGSYILNRWQKLGTITKDMWVARTMSRYFNEPNTGEPWLTTKEGNNKRMILDKAWGEVAKRLGVEPAQVQEMMWDAEKKLYARLGHDEGAAYTSEGVDASIARAAREKISMQEQSKFSKTATSIKNAAVDKARAKRGADEIMAEAVQSNDSTVQSALQKISRDPDWASRLVEEIFDNPRTTSPEETFALDHHYYQLKKTFNAIGKSIYDLDTKPDSAQKNADLNDLSLSLASAAERLDRAENVFRTAGREWGRSGQFRQRAMKDDFSLAALALRRRAALRRALLPAELADLSKQWKELEDAKSEWESHRDTITEQASKAAYDEAHRKIMADVSTASSINPKILSAAKRIVDEINKEANDAMAQLQAMGLAEERAKFSKTASETGAAPEEAIDPKRLELVSKVGTAFLTKGDTSFAEWSKKMQAQLPAWVTPYLRPAYDAANNITDAKVNRVPAAAREQVKRVIKNASPAEQRDIQTAKIKAKIADKDSGDITPNVQKMARALIDMGIRDKYQLVDAVHAELVKVVPEITRDEAMDAISGYGKFSPMTKDETSIILRDYKGQFQQIAKLRDMAAGKAPLRTGKTRGVPTAEERALLKQVVAAKRKGGYEATDPEKQLRTALQEEEAKVKNQIQDLQKQIDSKTKTVREKYPAPTSPAIEALKKQRDELRETYNDIFGVKDVSDARRLELWKNKTDKRIAYLENKVKTNDFSKPVRRAPVKLDSDGFKKKYRVDRLKNKFREADAKHRLEGRTTWQKMTDAYVSWSRNAKLLNWHVYPKLALASMSKLAFDPARRVFVQPLKLIPGLSAKDPYMMELSLRAEAKNLAAVLSATPEAWNKLRHGASSIDVMAGKGQRDFEMQSFIGLSHGFIKEYIRQGGFAHSVEIRAMLAEKQGLDISDPVVDAAITSAAVCDANRRIFMSDNLITKTFHKLVVQGLMQQSDKGVFGAREIAKAIEFLMPIVKVPTNIGIHTTRLATGLFEAGARLAYHARRGDLANESAKLTEKDAQQIVESFGLGVLGLVLASYAWNNPDKFGGVWDEEGRTRMQKKQGEIETPVGTIPGWLNHTPEGMFLNIVASARRVHDRSVLKSPDENLTAAMNAVAFTLMAPVRNMPFIDTWVRTFGSHKNPGQILGGMVRDSTIPSIFTSYLKDTDKMRRSPKTFIQEIEMGIPVLRKNVPINMSNPFAEQ